MLPFSGVDVIEFCNVAAGPFCGMLLADMGANVIKVEHPNGGDTMRGWPPLTDGFSENFALNRNKRSVTLDLKNTNHVQRARDLIRTADVLIENNRPGVMARLGLGYEEVCRDNPKLVYCSISAYGQSGPRSQEGGFDLTLQAMAGIMSVTGEPGGAPVKWWPVADFASPTLPFRSLQRCEVLSTAEPEAISTCRCSGRLSPSPHCRRRSSSAVARTRNGSALPIHETPPIKRSGRGTPISEWLGTTRCGKMYVSPWVAKTS